MVIAIKIILSRYFIICGAFGIYFVETEDLEKKLKFIVGRTSKEHYIFFKISLRIIIQKESTKTDKKHYIFL